MRALLVLVCFLAANAAHADVHHEALFGSHVRALRTRSANALTDQSLAGPTFGYGYRLPLEVMPKLELWGTAGLQLGFADGEMFQTLTTDLGAVQLAGGVRARYPLWRDVVVANARVELAAQRVDVTLADMAGHSARDAGWGAASAMGLGLELNLLARRSVAIGFRVEYGYVMAQAIELTAKSDGAPEGTIELDRMAASIGHLDLGGRYLSFMLTTRF